MDYRIVVAVHSWHSEKSMCNQLNCSVHGPLNLKANFIILVVGLHSV